MDGNDAVVSELKKLSVRPVPYAKRPARERKSTCKKCLKINPIGVCGGPEMHFFGACQYESRNEFCVLCTAGEAPSNEEDEEDDTAAARWRQVNGVYRCGACYEILALEYTCTRCDVVQKWVTTCNGCNQTYCGRCESFTSVDVSPIALGTGDEEILCWEHLCSRCMTYTTVKEWQHIKRLEILGPQKEQEATE